MPNVALSFLCQKGKIKEKKIQKKLGTRVADLTVVPYSTTADIFRHPTMISQSHCRHKVPQNVGLWLALTRFIPFLFFSFFSFALVFLIFHMAIAKRKHGKRKEKDSTIKSNSFLAAVLFAFRPKITHAQHFYEHCWPGLKSCRWLG